MSIVLFGAGSAGRYALKHLRAQGIEPIGFADNDEHKWAINIDNLPVMSVEYALDHSPDATWICAAISRPAATEIREHIKALGVKTKPLYECLPVFHDNPSPKVQRELIDMVVDAESVLTLQDLYAFRENPNYEKQRDPSPISELYFPPFISHKDDEVFVDCGACDGDSVKAFMARWNEWKSIVAFEPDSDNYDKLCLVFDPKGEGRITTLGFGVSDFEGIVSFVAHGDYSSHLGDGNANARVVKMDYFMGDVIPTYIKMDIEGSEPDALWGARRILKDHSPVLAICAYHTSEHTWQIPLLVHAINPTYKCYFRRYAEGAFELVWYFVPPERVI